MEEAILDGRACAERLFGLGRRPAAGFEGEAARACAEELSTPALRPGVRHVAVGFPGPGRTLNL